MPMGKPTWSCAVMASGSCWSPSMSQTGPCCRSRTFIGVDLGVVNLATTSDATHTGDAVEACRTRYARRRQRLQKAAHVVICTASGPRTSGVPCNGRPDGKPPFAVMSIIVISKGLVAAATDTMRGIALEDLEGMRQRGTPFRQSQRARHVGLGLCPTPPLHRVQSILVWRPCGTGGPQAYQPAVHVCGHIARANRRSQAVFSCHPVVIQPTPMSTRR